MKTKDVADHFGGKKRLAEALGISPSAVTMWGDQIPASRQYQIQVLTKGKFEADPSTPALAEALPVPTGPDRRTPAQAEDRRGRRETDLSPAQAKELVSSAEQFLQPLKRIANA